MMMLRYMHVQKFGTCMHMHGASIQALCFCAYVYMSTPLVSITTRAAACRTPFGVAIARVIAALWSS